LIDREAVGTVKPAEKLEMWIPAQEHLMTAESVSCLDSSETAYELNLKPKQRKVMRVSMPPSFQPALDE
jgi:hypothetical protein